MQILFEDNHLIAINKPHGQLVQADEGGELSLLDEVKAFIKNRDQKPGNVFVGLLHRLDRPVGGVVLFAKTSKGASRISDQFRRHTIEKVYWAIVEGRPEKSGGEVIQWLVKDEVANLVTPYDHEVPNSQKAELSYRALERSLIEIKPKTGRPHQIRVAMASLGCPIVGDLKYGAKTKLNHDIALFARSLSFDHPVTKERITVTAEPTLEIFRDLR
ncbi:MAG: RluA family pseudouridine synthase [Patescibacteria group bacterium]